MIPYKIIESFDSETIGDILDRYKNDLIVPIRTKKDIHINDIIYHVEYGEGIINGLDNDDIVIVDFNNNNIKFFDINYLLNNEKIIKIEKSDNIEEEEEEYDDIDEFFEDITIDDMLNNNIEYFFTKDELSLTSTIDDVERFKNIIKKQTPKNSFSKKLKDKRLSSINILEKSFNNLSTKYPNKKIYRFSGEIPYSDMWDNRQKDYIYSPKSKINTTVIYYWEFKDSVLFKIN